MRNVLVFFAGIFFSLSSLATVFDVLDGFVDRVSEMRLKSLIII